MCFSLGQSPESCLSIYEELYTPLGPGVDGNHCIAAPCSELLTSRDAGAAEVALSAMNLLFSIRKGKTKGQVCTNRGQRTEDNCNGLID